MNILITGTNSGLGRALYSRFKDCNYHNVYGVDCIDDGVPSTVDSICDVRKAYDIKDLRYDLAAKGYKVDIIINNAGINWLQWIHQMTESQWDLVMDTNAKGIFLMCKQFYQELKENQGTVLNILSNAATKPMTNSLVYNASKAAAEMMTRQISREWAPEGITVFGISPNKLTDTKMSDYVDEVVPGLRGWTKEYAMEYEYKSMPAGGPTDLRQLVEFIYFLFDYKESHKYLAGNIIPYGL